MDFSQNKTAIEVIREDAFGGTYFRGIYSNASKIWYKNSWKEFEQLKNIDAKFYAPDYYGKNLNKYKAKTRKSQRFGKIKTLLIKKVLVPGFSGILGTGYEEDRKIIKDKLIDRKDCKQLQG